MRRDANSTEASFIALDADIRNGQSELVKVLANSILVQRLPRPQVSHDFGMGGPMIGRDEQDGQQFGDLSRSHAGDPVRPEDSHRTQ